MHKKQEHEDLVPACHSFRKGKCDFPAAKCWYKHMLESKNTATQNTLSAPGGSQQEKNPNQATRDRTGTVKENGKSSNGNDNGNEKKMEVMKN